MNKGNENEKSNNINEERINQIDVKISELILTPLTCASIVNEVIKCLVYQKLQIPYPYCWLKSVVGRKRANTGHQEASVNLKVQRHFNVVSAAYDTLENILQNIKTEFKDYGNDIKQILVLFGSTPYTPKEIYKVKVESLANGHLEENHAHFNSRNQHKILRSIVFDERWLSAMDSLIPPTNMYILLQKHTTRNLYSDERFFQPNVQYSSSIRSESISITLNYERQSKLNCCENLLIFEDLSNKEFSIDDNAIENCNDNISVAESLMWFQARDTLKGFKECFINGSSATELW